MADMQDGDRVSKKNALWPFVGNNWPESQAATAAAQRTVFWWTTALIVCRWASSHIKKFYAGAWNWIWFTWLGVCGRQPAQNGNWIMGLCKCVIVTSSAESQESVNWNAFQWSWDVHFISIVVGCICNWYRHEGINISRLLCCIDGKSCDTGKIMSDSKSSLWKMWLRQSIHGTRELEIDCLHFVLSPQVFFHVPKNLLQYIIYIYFHFRDISCAEVSTLRWNIWWWETTQVMLNHV